MYRVFLADDNDLTRQALRTSIEWKNHGFELAGEAANGTDALQRVQELQPDILLLDIRMPGMTGLEVAQLIRKERPECLCIIISAYDEFAYAKQSLQLGIFDYLLKPISNVELLRVLSRAADMLDSRQKKDNEWKQLLQCENNYHKMLKRKNTETLEKLFAEAVNGYANAGEELQELIRSKWNFHGYELLLLAPADGAHLSIDETTMSEFITFEKNNIVFYENRDNCLLLNVPRREGLLVLVTFCQLHITREYDRIVQCITEKLLKENQAHGRTVTAAISGLSHSFYELPQMLDHCLMAMDSRFFQENRHILFFHELENTSTSNEYVLTQKLTELRRLLAEDPEKIQDYIESIYQIIRQSENCDMRFVKDVFIQIAIMITCALQERIRQMPGKTLNEIITELNLTANFSEAYQWLNTYAEQMVSTYRKTTAQHYSKQAVKIMDYLNCHYAEKIMLSDVAEAVGISGSHICRILKNETGETLVTILNKIRIRKAIQLLKEGNMKVYEIADSVGIRNYAYFYQLFKKETGCPPTDYHFEN